MLLAMRRASSMVSTFAIGVSSSLVAIDVGERLLGSCLLKVRPRPSNPAASCVATGASLPNALTFSRVAPSSTLAAMYRFAHQAFSAVWDQSINQILCDSTPHWPAHLLVPLFLSPLEPSHTGLGGVSQT